MGSCRSRAPQVQKVQDNEGYSSVEHDSTDREPLYNLIMRREPLSKLNAVVDFRNSTIQIKSEILSIQLSSAIEDPWYGMNVYQESLALEITERATTYVTYILDIKHEKADLKDVVNMHQKVLLLLFLKFQE